MQHGCSVDLAERGKMPTCPVCSATIKIKASDNVDEVVSRHIASGCKEDVFDVALEKKKQKDAKHCAYAGCRNVEKYETILCNACGEKYCLTHRHQDTHKCPNLHAGPTRKGNSAASRLLEQLAEKKASKAAAAASTPAAPRSEKELAAARMRLRLRAKGDSTVKEHNRFYMEVLPPALSLTGAALSLSPQAVWMDMNWTVGRVLEKLAASFHLENRNHIQGAKHLQLTNPQSQATFPHDVTLSLLIPELRSGDTVQLVYV